MAGILVLVLVAACGQPRPNAVAIAPLPSLEVLPATTSFEVGDPLILKVTVLNPTTDDLRFAKEISSASGLIEWEMSPLRKNWTRVPAEFEGIAEFDSPQVVAPGKSFCTDVQIYRANGRVIGEFVFAEPGEYQLRAKVRSDKGVLESEPITLTARKSSPGKLDYVRKTHRHFTTFLVPSRRSAKHATVFPLSYDSLPEGHLRACLEGTELFIRWQTSEPFSDDERMQLEKLQKHMVQLGPVMREQYWLAMASHLVDKRRYAEATALLDKLPDPSAESLYLRKEIERRASPASIP